MSSYSGLRAAGLVNEVMPDVAQLTRRNTRPIVGTCTSQKCSPSGCPTIKDVVLSADICPDCKSALKWTPYSTRFRGVKPEGI